VVSNEGTRTSLTLSGTPDKPEISGSEMLMNVMGRPLNLVQNLAGNAIGGGIEIVSGAADAAGKLAKGAGDTVLGFGKGLLNTGKGLLKGDLKEAGKGLEEATVGTVTTAGTAVADSTGAATSGVQGAVSAGTGGARQISWREENQTRHEAFESAAKEWLESGTFPPDPTKIAPEKTPERKEPVSDERGDEDGQRAAEAVNEG